MLEAREELLTAALFWDMDFLERVMFSSIWEKKNSKPPNPSRREAKVRCTLWPLLLLFLPLCLKKAFSISTMNNTLLSADGISSTFVTGKSRPQFNPLLIHSRLGLAPALHWACSCQDLSVSRPGGLSPVSLPCSPSGPRCLWSRPPSFHSLGFLVSKASSFLLLFGRSFSLSFGSCSFLCPFYKSLVCNDFSFADFFFNKWNFICIQAQYKNWTHNCRWKQRLVVVLSTSLPLCTPPEAPRAPLQIPKLGEAHPTQRSLGGRGPSGPWLGPFTAPSTPSPWTVSSFLGVTLPTLSRPHGAWEGQ